MRAILLAYFREVEQFLLKYAFAILFLAEKIIDNFLKWGFRGKLVKFKFLSAIKDIEALIANPESCFFSSSADILVANCFESMYEGLHVVNKKSGSGIFA